MTTVAIMGNGPTDILPDLKLYKDEVDVWVGADRGALTLIKQQINVDYAVGDFDSISSAEKKKIENRVKHFEQYPSEKDQSDLEIALHKAFELNPTKIFLFGLTGGRLDHTLINIQTLLQLVKKGIKGIILDKLNYVELMLPGTYQVEQSKYYRYISFIPITKAVKGLTLSGFYYPLENETITFGSSRSISNELLSNNGTFSYREGILLLVKSRDLGNTIHM